MDRVDLPVVSFDDTSIAFSSKSNKDLHKMNRLFSLMNSRFLVGLGTKVINFSVKVGLPIKRILKNTIFSQFCGGEDIKECTSAIQKLADFGIGTILDYSVEGAETEENFEKTKEEIIKTIHKAEGNAFIPFCVFKVTGLGSTAVLQSASQEVFGSDSEKEAFEKIRDRVNQICEEAFRRDVRVFIDGEETWIQDAIDMLAYEMMRKYNREKPIVYNTYQMYRKDMFALLEKAFHDASGQDYFLGVKAVRGAYIEKERANALKKGYPDPMQPDKVSSDRDFDRALEFCLERIDRIALCAGTHNEKSSKYLTELMQKYNIAVDDSRIWFAQLYGMSDHISYNLAVAGYNVAKYVPYGPLEAVLPYLFRRARENTSVAGQTGRELTLIRKEIKRRKSINRARE